MQRWPWREDGKVAQPQDPVRELADALRGKGGVETRAAVLDDQRKELMRGKDLVRWVKAHPVRCTKLVPGARVGGGGGRAGGHGGKAASQAYTHARSLARPPARPPPGGAAA